MSEKHASETKEAPKPVSDALKRANEARAKAARERAEARKRDEAEAAANAPEQVPGFHVITPFGETRYVCDHDGYQTAYAHEAKAHLARIGKA